MYRDDDNSWVAPLPFKEPRQLMPNNRELALSRFSSLKRSMQRKPHMQLQYVEFMEAIFSNGHAEVAPELEQGEECWFLPTFGVYHPQKPDKIRVVFDSSAQHSGVSLNNVLLTGPDLNNSLIGVLLRFRPTYSKCFTDSWCAKTIVTTSVSCGTRTMTSTRKIIA